MSSTTGRIWAHRTLGFSRPLPLEGHIEAFSYRGESRDELVTDEMRREFEAFREAYCPGTFRHADAPAS